MIDSMIQQACRYFSFLPLWFLHNNNKKKIYQCIFTIVMLIICNVLLIMLINLIFNSIFFDSVFFIAIAKICSGFVMTVVFLFLFIVKLKDLFDSCYAYFYKQYSFYDIKNHTNLICYINTTDVDFFLQSRRYYYVGTINQENPQIISKKHHIKSLNGNKVINISPQFKKLTKAVNKPQVSKYFRIYDGSKNILSVKNGQLILTNVSQTQFKNARLVLNDTKQKTQLGFKKQAAKQKVAKNITLYIAQ